ncbi:DnaJ domain-containing protein [Campylobacter hyointestinalis]|uniref:DnaJ domain-containing protein n=1 Tax=Campylobacter hyointestinalis subsp. lawsonii TaxID=91353 RepID=A0AAV6EE41_CAMHY|nr:DnaJ domain-containing protein [Campylobacter hyointestinalis]ANE34833.1 DnaJ-like membrane chaperone protein (N-terminal terB-like domain) [Campylobacter hyointestinalis subsp. lawsonii CCUG 27631]KAB0612493.1 DnaJ domain-containing protein [Campylobacter hyointestinalis subsp. lawsonii]QKF68945.1 DnaJ-like membrane chaperone protein [Campylobacter hyointestinalis subsp. lawsonii]RAZ29483.1 molecular chaperone DjlA [Campylobacter hyointestinalis subsp. lawsonii]RAZ52681.1 molecular chapero
MNVFLVFLAAIILFYALSKGYLLKPATPKNFALLDAKFLIRLLAKVAKSDGIVDKTEASYISLVLDDICSKLGNDSIRYELKQIYTQEKDSQTKAFDIALEYKTLLNLKEQTCINLVVFFLNLAYIDGEFSDSERKTLIQICDGFGLSDDLCEQLFTKFGAELRYKNTNDLDPYKILEIDKDASFDEIKKQYRKLAKQNHPDFLAGADEKVISNATKRLQEINEAYAVLKAKFEK